jgi:hypothetical protein
MKLRSSLCPAIETASKGECGPGDSVTYTRGFSADTGDDVTLDHLMPQSGDTVVGSYAIQTGVPIEAGAHYVFIARIYESDVIGGDDMGSIVSYVDAEHNWGIGTFTARSLHPDGSPGDFDLTFEIARTPLPDLRMNGFQVTGSPGREAVCGLVENAGQRNSGEIYLILETEGKIIRQASLAAQDPGQGYWLCLPRSIFPAKKHNLVYSIDPLRTLVEMDELNNVGVYAVAASPSGVAAEAEPGAAGAATGAVDPEPSAPAAGVSPSPQPKPSGAQPAPNGAQADLTVRAINVNGQVPDGKDDCKPGKNTVTVLVKNAGAGDAGSFSMHLVVDGAEADTTVDALAAGQEREVTFENIEMRKGERTLKAAADPARAIDESDEANNERKLTARCTDGG